MQLIRISSATAPIYQEAMALYNISFPRYEQRRATEQEQVMSVPEYNFTTLYEADNFIGLLLYWEHQEFIYIEHFCTLPALRGQGYGLKILDKLADQGKVIILEIDPPKDDISIRRQAFYERAGYVSNTFVHVHPPYRAEYPGHTLVVMSQPTRLTQAVYDQFACFLNNKVMKYAQKQ